MMGGLLRRSSTAMLPRSRATWQVLLTSLALISALVGAEGVRDARRAIADVVNVTARGPIAPLPPVWPTRFQVEFVEDTLLLQTRGIMYYDAEHNRTRIDRANGLGDSFCGSALPFRSAKCTHLVRDGLHYLYYPNNKYCCKCCTDEAGCGILPPDWLGPAVYSGQDTIYGYDCAKWTLPGILQNWFYWEGPDHVPMRFTVEFITQQTFLHDTFSQNLTDSVFDLPANLDCSPQCWGLCLVATNALKTRGPAPAVEVAANADW